MKSPIKVFIFGSCVSRDPFEIANLDSFEVVDYFARSSLASLSSDALVDERILSSVKSNWQKRMIRADMDKSFFNVILDKGFDVLLVDFIDERFSLAAFESSVHTISTEYRRALYQPNKYRFIKNNSQEKMNLWREGLKKFAGFLRENNSAHKLVVNKVFWSTKCKDKTGVFSKYTQRQIDEANEQLSIMYSEVERELPDVRFIRYSDDELEIDPNHKWGIDPFHYTHKAFYKQLNELTKLFDEGTLKFLHGAKMTESERINIPKLEFIEFYKEPIDKNGKFLSIERAQYSDDDLLFLEDATCLEEREVICVTRNTNRIIVLKSDSNIDEFELTEFCKRKIKNCHTLVNGNRIIQTAEPCENFLVDKNFKLIKKVNAGQRLWHGTNSIDSNGSGVVMYSEYTASKDKDAQPLYVWCSYDFGMSWQVVMKKMSSPVYGVGDCRHFHTCFADPKIPKRWYVTTGDVRRDNSFYYSNDNGASWIRAEVSGIVPGGLIPKEYTDNVFRFTSSNFDGDDIVWPTDDSLGLKKAMFIRMDRTKLPNVEIRVEHIFDENLMRSSIYGDSAHGVFISEAKHKIDGLSLYYTNGTDKKIVKMPDVPNLSGEPSGGTISKASSKFLNDTAYSLADIRLFGDGKPSLLRYKILSDKELLTNEYSLDTKSVNGRPLVFFHAQRTAGTTIKNAFLNEYGKSNCLYQRTSEYFCDWKLIDESVLKKYNIYAGHYNYFPKKFKIKPLIFSIIRDPIDRAISLYYYLKNRPEHKLHELAVKEDILTFYRKAFEVAPDYVSNTQTLRVAGKKSFSDAKKIVEQDYFLLAPFNKLKQVFEIFSALRLISAKNCPEFKSSKPKHKEYYDPEFREYILSINREDTLLYEFSKVYLNNFECV